MANQFWDQSRQLQESKTGLKATKRERIPRRHFFEQLFDFFLTWSKQNDLYTEFMQVQHFREQSVMCPEKVKYWLDLASAIKLQSLAIGKSVSSIFSFCNICVTHSVPNNSCSAISTWLENNSPVKCSWEKSEEDGMQPKLMQKKMTLNLFVKAFRINIFKKYNDTESSSSTNLLH